MTPILIYIVLPCVFLLGFMALAGYLYWQDQPTGMHLGYAMLFTNYGSVLQILLTAFFWKWSALASLEYLYFCFLSPAMAAFSIAYWWFRKQNSAARSWLLRLNILYLILFLVLLIVLRFK